MIKADLVNCVAEGSGVSRVKAAKAVESLLYAMKEALGQGKRIELRGKEGQVQMERSQLFPYADPGSVVECAAFSLVVPSGEPSTQLLFQSGDKLV